MENDQTPQIGNEHHEGSRHVGRPLSMEALSALAHPLRQRIFDALSMFGPATASGLGERLGESSGATSYHLRQLAKHNFVREVEGRGVGRERWWERVPEPVGLNAFEETESAKKVTKIIVDSWHETRERLVSEFLNADPESIPEEWMSASVINTANLQVTADELREFNERLVDLIGDFADAHRDRTVPGSRPVQIQFSSFPIVGGDEVPEEPQP